jgi:aminopeptidase
MIQKMNIYTQRLARLIIDYSLEVKEGQQVGINGLPAAGSLIRALYKRILERGAHPYLRLGLPGTEEIFFRTAGDSQIEYVSTIDQLSVEEYDAGVTIMSSSNTRSLTNIPAEKISMRHFAQKPIFERFLERLTNKELKWCGTIVPTNAYAQDAEMSLEEYSNFLYSACGVNEENYIETWQEISRGQAEMIEFLKGKKKIQLLGIDTDLVFSIDGRRFINCDGRENMPDGEIFTSPVEGSVEGRIRFSYPVCEGGREIEDIYLEFERGKVVKAKAKKNEDYLLKMLDTDEGARGVGEFGVGNNPGIDRFTRAILFDEKIKGTIHIALGLSFPEAGGLNKSAIHWDMICDLRQGGEILVDGNLFCKGGEFLLHG